MQITSPEEITYTSPGNNKKGGDNLSPPKSQADSGIDLSEPTRENPLRQVTITLLSVKG